LIRTFHAGAQVTRVEFREDDVVVHDVEGLRLHREQTLEKERNVDAVDQVRGVVVRRAHEVLELDVLQERERYASQGSAIPAERQAEHRAGPPGAVCDTEVASKEKAEH